MSTSPITPRPPPTVASPLHPPAPSGASRAPRAAPAGVVHRATSSSDGIAATSRSGRRSELVAALLAFVPAADRDAAKTAIPAILDAAHSSGTSDPNRIGYLLATAQTESDFGANMTETGHSKAWFNSTYGGADGNRPGTDDGYTYRGRGYVQTTRAGRYAELSRHLGLADVPASAGGPAVQRSGSTMIPALVAHPEKLAEPKLAARALVAGVLKNLFTHNAKAALDTTVPAGRKPGAVDFYHARGIVNGIVRSQAEAIANHATLFARVLDGYRHSVLGVREIK